jgi:hypothetical protein
VAFILLSRLPRKIVAMSATRHDECLFILDGLFRRRTRILK